MKKTKIKMKKTDFSVCSFIRNELNFFTYYDFCKNAKVFKKYYNKFSKDEKIFYKWYVYANIHMDEGHKNYIWDYLNSDDPQAYINLINNINKSKIN